jgi:CBS domain-containing protein
VSGSRRIKDSSGSRSLASQFANKTVPFGLPGAWSIESVIPHGQELVCVAPQTPLNQVKTLMTLHGLSQVPVLKNKRKDLVGTITWRSLAAYDSEGKSYARQAMVAGRSPRADVGELLMHHIQSIIDYDFIYVKNQDDEYIGIVTTTDLARTFLEISGPFMKLSEVEMRLRDLLRPLPFEDVRRSIVLPTKGSARGETSSEVTQVDDMTIGQYRVALENKTIWDAVGLPYDRAAILANLQVVNTARNAVMHFRPDPLPGEQSLAIDQALNWLRQCSDRASSGVSPSVSAEIDTTSK